MNRVKIRSIAILVLVAMLVTGTAFYLGKFFANGKKWVSFAPNSHVYTNGVLTAGNIYDRNGEILASSSDGKRTYNETRAVRRALLHVVGDREGNIGTSVLNRFADRLMGYDVINGVYTFADQPTSLNLTVDAKLCETAYDALSGSKGTVLVCNYKTGEIVCMVSSPNFDPLDPPDPGDLDDEDAAYMNRALSGVFTPGSIFKLVTLAAAIDTVDGLFDMTFECNGKAIIAGQEINCMHRHGTVDIYDALSGSCNSAFAQLAQKVGSENLYKYAKKFGLCDSHSVNGIKTASGSVNTAEDGSAELSWAAIGQHEDLVNPEAVLRMMNAIAARGKAAEPRLIKSVINSLGIPEGLYFTEYSGSMIKEQTAEKMAEMMRRNVTEEYGQSRFGDLPVCAKSGTAEVGNGKRAHSWFVGFVDSEEYPYSFVAFVENGGSGSSVAGEIVSRVLSDIE